MKKCIILSPPISMGDSIRRAFASIGWDAKLITFQTEPKYGRFHPVTLIRTRELGHFSDERFDAVLRDRALPAAIESHADLLLVVRPECIGNSTVDMLRKFKGKIACWIIDSVKRFPSQDGLASWAQQSFFLDRVDATRSNSHWLPMGIDSKLLPKELPAKDIDILLIGCVKPKLYESRRSALFELSKSELLNKYHATAVLAGVNRFQLKLLQNVLKPIEVIGGVPMEKYIHTIARSKVCINILPDDGDEIINDAFFLVPSVDACEITDRRDYLANWLSPGQQFCWFSKGELIPTIKSLLEDDTYRNRIAEDGGFTVRANHTYINRVNFIVDKSF